MTGFQAAWAEWLTLNISEDEESYARLDALEIELLNHRPKTLDEARRVLDLIVAQAEMRSDGLDWTALKNVRAVIIAAVHADERPDARRAAA